LQEQQWPQGGNPGPIEACRQKSRRHERDDNTGTDSKCAAGACSPAAYLAARITRLPVMWAMNRVPSPRNPITSTLPAMTLSTKVNNLVPSGR